MVCGSVVGFVGQPVFKPRMIVVESCPVIIGEIPSLQSSFLANGSGGEATKVFTRRVTALQRCELGEVSLWQFEDSFELVVHVGSIGCGLNTAQLRQARHM